MSSHIFMTNDQNGTSSLTKKPVPEFSDLDFPGWQGVAVQDAGVFMFMFNIAADAAEFPIHVSDEAWLAYVISGTGTLVAGTADKQKTTGMEYKAGDFITFAADTPHGWVNGGEHSRILFTKRI